MPSAGLLNADDPAAAQGALALACSQFAACMGGPAGDRTRARLLLRLLAALVPPNVLHAASVVEAFQGVVDRCVAVAAASESCGRGRLGGCAACLSFCLLAKAQLWAGCSHADGSSA